MAKYVDISSIYGATMGETICPLEEVSPMSLNDKLTKYLQAKGRRRKYFVGGESCPEVSLRRTNDGDVSLSSLEMKKAPLNVYVFLKRREEKLLIF